MSRRPAYPSAEPANAGVPDIERHISLVKKIAYLLMSRLPASVELDDLVQVGLIGLIEASRQFDASQGVLFETFASQRVRGAMLDELRRPVRRASRPSKSKKPFPGWNKTWRARRASRKLPRHWA